MANLPTEDRVRIWRGIMRWYSAPDTNETLSGILKADLQAAVNAADAWADSAAGQLWLFVSGQLVDVATLDDQFGQWPLRTWPRGYGT